MFYIYSLDGDAVNLKIARYKRTTGKVYRVEFDNLEIPKDGKATLVFSKRKNPRFKMDIDYENDGKYDSYKLPDTMMTK